MSLPLPIPRFKLPMTRRTSGTLDHFLTERYCLYTVLLGRLRPLEIDHPPWRLQRAEAEIRANTLASSQGVPLDTTRAPLLHFSARQD